VPPPAKLFSKDEAHRIAANTAKLPENECRSRSSTPQGLAADAPRAFRRRCSSAMGALARRMAVRPAGAALRAYLEWTRRGRDGGPSDHSQTEGISWSRTSLRMDTTITFSSSSLKYITGVHLQTGRPLLAGHLALCATPIVRTLPGNSIGFCHRHLRSCYPMSRPQAHYSDG
jgi:hypothetical protein